MSSSSHRGCPGKAGSPGDLPTGITGTIQTEPDGYVLEKLLAHITSKIKNFVCFTILDLGEDADKHLHVIWS